MPKRKQAEPALASLSSKASKKKTSGTKGGRTKASSNSASEEEVLNFGKAYGWALYCGAEVWNFHDDSGCWWDTCQDQSQTYGNWTALYKPGKGMKECEDWRYSVLFLRKAGAPPVTDALWNEVQPMIEHVNRLYLQSYNDLRRVTKGKWSDAIRDGTVEEIAKIVSSLKFDRTIRMSMEVRGIRETEEFKANDSWTPRRLAKWLGLYEGDDVAYEDVMDISGHYLPSVRFYKELPEEYYWFTQDSVEAVNCE